ncbi:hypothetical protein GL503_27175 [Salmonella enterica]|nr:hypothetical protein [Salmonella enterica]
MHIRKLIFREKYFEKFMCYWCAYPCKAAKLQSCKAAKLQSCKAAKLQSCKAAKLQSCKAAKLARLAVFLTVTGLLSPNLVWGEQIPVWAATNCYHHLGGFNYINGIRLIPSLTAGELSITLEKRWDVIGVDKAKYMNDWIFFGAFSGGYGVYNVCFSTDVWPQAHLINSVSPSFLPSTPGKHTVKITVAVDLPWGDNNWLVRPVPPNGYIPTLDYSGPIAIRATETGSL